MRALIVGKTKMAQRACVGALSLTDGKSLRLFNDVPGRDRYPLRGDYEVGDVWELRVKRSPEEEPHVEGVIVESREFIGRDVNTRQTVLGLISAWRQPLGSTFGGTLYSNGNNYYLRRGDPLPDRSTWFWVSDQHLTFDGTHYTYAGDGHRIAHTGLGPASSIRPGELVRLSLAGWWKNDSMPQERCYLQISGSLG